MSPPCTKVQQDEKRPVSRTRYRVWEKTSSMLYSIQGLRTQTKERAVKTPPNHNTNGSQTTTLLPRGSAGRWQSVGGEETAGHPRRASTRNLRTVQLLVLSRPNDTHAPLNAPPLQLGTVFLTRKIPSLILWRGHLGSGAPLWTWQSCENSFS